MGLVKEFREFILKGNVVDLAVGVIIGAAFGAVVSSLVTDVLMPPIGYLMGGIDFKDKTYLLAKAGPHPVTQEMMKETVISYGKFLNALIALLIQGLAVFVVIKIMNSMKKPAPAAGPPPLTKDQELLVEIRDALRKK